MARENKGSTFHQRLTASMRKLRINKRQLAKAVDLSYEMVRRYCNGAGKPRTVDAYLRIAAALNVGAEWLMDGDGAVEVTARVPLMKITDADIRAGGAKESVLAPAGFLGIAVRMTVVLGDGFKQGDIVFVRILEGELPPAEACVLLEVKDKKVGAKHLFRRVQYRSTESEPFAMTFHSYDPQLPSVLDQKQARVVGIAEHLLTKLS